jgi:transposase
LPSAASAAFVAAMEDVLDVYQRAPDPARPLVCFDEAGKELQADVRASLPPRPGRAARIDSEYQRHGRANLFLWCAPHLGQRQVTVTQQRTRTDWAEQMRALVDQYFPHAERIVVVLDNLNTHTAASLYATFPSAEAKRIWDKLEVHYTPIHGSWLNMAEIELSALARQCLHRRLPTRDTLAREVAAWVADRNTAQVTIDWQFTTADARVKLKRLYPVLQSDNS